MFLMSGPEHTPLKFLDDLLNPFFYLISLEFMAIIILIIMQAVKKRSDQEKSCKTRRKVLQMRAHTQCM